MLKKYWPHLLLAALVLGTVATASLNGDTKRRVEVQNAVGAEPDDYDHRTTDGPPHFQMPFPCGEVWRIADTHGRDVNALDMGVGRVNGQTVGAEGRPVVASADGTVTFAGWEDGGGHTVSIDHGAGWETHYRHLQEELQVSDGQSVSQGQQLGRASNSGNNAGDWPHLHYEQVLNDELVWVVWNGERVPPTRGVPRSQLPWLESKNCPPAADDENKPHDPPVTSPAPGQGGVDPRTVPPDEAPPPDNDGGEPGPDDDDGAQPDPTDPPPPQRPECPEGNFCAYSGPDQTGILVVTEYGNWESPTSFGVPIRSVFNNGHSDPGQDHIQLVWKDRTGQHEMCLHYGDDPSARHTFADPARIVSATWRGEC